MSDDIQFAPDPTDAVLSHDVAALDAALAQARAELQAMSDEASTASTETGADTLGPYSLHEVPGVGRYAIPRRSGWAALHKIIRDPVANIDFSEPDYPLFDDVIAEHFNSPKFLDPADDDFNHYQNLRDNVSAVRNFLMTSFYAPNSGLSPEKAKASLKEIAAFVGDGLYNNFRVTVLDIPLLPFHDPKKPFISLSAAMAGNGQGAQYIYEKILEHQQRWDWTRPFDAIREMFGFGGSWKLPPENTTGFTDIFAKDLAGTQIPANPTLPQVNSMIMAAVAKVQALEAKRAQVNGARELNQMANELEYIGDHLLHSAHHLDEITTLSKPVRMDAIAEARKILQGLKVWIGDKNILDGLKLKPTEDMSTFHAIKGVTEVYSRLLAWARGVDASILNHPGIAAATQAMGQLGYLAKLEALNFAKATGNQPRIARITEELKNVDARFATATDATFGGLLNKLENGINVILNRVTAKDVPGAMVAHTAGNELGSYMSAAPTAGMAQTLGGESGVIRDAVGKRNAEMLMAEEAQLQAQAAQIQAQNAARAKQQGAQPAAPARPAAGAARQGLAQAQRQQRQQSSTTTSVNPNANAAQRQQQAMLANRNMLNAQHHHEEEAHHQHEAQLRQAQLMQQQLMQQKMQAALKQANVNKTQIQQAMKPTGMSSTAPNPATMNKAAYMKMQADQAAAAAKAAASNPDKAKDMLSTPPVPKPAPGRGM